MLGHFVKPHNNSYFAPLRQVVSGHFQLSGSHSFHRRFTNETVVKKELFRAAGGPPHEDHGWAGARAFCPLLLFSLYEEVTLG